MRKLFYNTIPLRLERYLPLLLSICISLTVLLPTIVHANDPSELNTAPLPEFEVGKFQYCGVDADCTKAQNGCCDCANGGQDVAVNKARLAAFKKRFSCLNTTCSLKARIPACASGMVSCINHKCKYLEARDVKF